MGLKIRKGNVHDHAQDDTSLNAPPDSKIDYQEGDVFDYGQRKQVFEIRDSGKRTADEPSLCEIWGIGSFLLVALIVVAAVVGTFSFKLPVVVLPVAIAAAIVILYLLGVMLLPGRLSEKNLVSVLRDFFKFSFRPRKPESRPRSAHR